jgi:hypothetical protein
MFSVLICVVSLALQSSVVSLNIHNQCQDINLTSPVYFIHGGKWHVVPDQEIGVEAVMRNHIEFDSRQDILEGIMAYRIQRQCTGSDKFIQGESKNIQLLVTWSSEYTKELHVRALLVEYDKEFNWNEDMLRQLHQKYWQLLKERIHPIRRNWMLDDATVLATTIKAMNGCYRWDIFISERVGDDVYGPLWINAER